jgi:hypothetical protein
VDREEAGGGRGSRKGAKAQRKKLFFFFASGVAVATHGFAWGIVEVAHTEEERA